MKEKGNKGTLTHGKTAPIFGVLKWSWITAFVPLIISYFTTWKYCTLFLALILLLLTVSFRSFKDNMSLVELSSNPINNSQTNYDGLQWWVYRGTKQMGKKRYMKRLSLTSSLNPNQKTQ